MTSFFQQFFAHQVEIYRYSLYAIGALFLIHSLFSKKVRVPFGIFSLCSFYCATVSSFLLPPCIVSTVFLYVVSLSKTDYQIGKEDNASTLTFIPFVCLLIIVAIGIFFRFFHLDTIVNTFEGELAPYYVGATSLKGLFIANKGIDGPWAPLGVLFYIPIYIAIKCLGSTLVAVRISSAVVGTGTLILLYFVIRRVATHSIALLSAALFAVNSLHIGWSRTDVHPHGVTTWPALLIIYTSYLFFEKYTFRYALLLIGAMALSWHQYPSGQSAVIIPWLILFATIIIPKSRKTLSLKHFSLTLCVLIIGSLFWYLGLPTAYYFADGHWQFPNPFTLTSQRTSWGNTSEVMSVPSQVWFVVSQATEYLIAFFSGLTFKNIYAFHQDFLIELPGLYWRTYPVFLNPFLFLGAIYCIRNYQVRWCQLVLAMAIAALLPGILAERPYAKRMSVVFAALDWLSAVGLYVFYQSLSEASKRQSLILKSIFLAGYVFYVGWLSYAWFSGRQFQIGVPAEIFVAKLLSEDIVPGTLLTTDLGKDYDEGKFFYLLNDTIANPKNYPVKINVTSIYGRSMPEHWIHQWSQFADVESKNPSDVFHRFIFLFQNRSLKNDELSEKITLLTNQCEKTGKKVRVNHFEETLSFTNAMTEVVCYE